MPDAKPAVDTATILIVDDDAAVCWALEQVLKAQGYVVAIAADAAVARRLVRRQRPDDKILFTSEAIDDHSIFALVVADEHHAQVAARIIVGGEIEHLRGHHQSNVATVERKEMTSFQHSHFTVRQPQQAIDAVVRKGIGFVTYRH